MKRSLELLAGLLHPADREAVLGDLVESGVSQLNAHLDVAGLVVRRCLPPYASVYDWLGVAVACLVSPLLAGLGAAFFAQVSHEMSSVSTAGIMELFRLSAMLSSVAIAMGQAISSRARTFTALTVIALLLPAICCAFQSHGLQIATLFLFVIPGSCGAWLPIRRRRHEITLLLLTLGTIFSGPSILSDGPALLRASLLSAPALYCWSTRHYGAGHVPA